MLIFEFGYPIKKSAKAPRYPPSKARKSSQSIFLTKPAVVPSFILFRLEFGEHFYLPTSQAIGNKTDLGLKRNRTIELLLKIQDQN